jgi:hypothetical protein
MKGSWPVGHSMTACFGIQEVKALVSDLAMTMKIIKHEFRITNILEFNFYLTQKKILSVTKTKQLIL